MKRQSCGSNNSLWQILFTCGGSLSPLKLPHLRLWRAPVAPRARARVIACVCACTLVHNVCRCLSDDTSTSCYTLSSLIASLPDSGHNTGPWLYLWDINISSFILLTVGKGDSTIRYINAQWTIKTAGKHLYPIIFIQTCILFKEHTISLHIVSEKNNAETINFAWWSDSLIILKVYVCRFSWSVFYSFYNPWVAFHCRQQNK